MGRKRVGPDKKLRSRTFSLSEEHMALIEAYADTYDLSSSQAVRRLLDIAYQSVDADVRMDVARRRSSLLKKIVPLEKRTTTTKVERIFPEQCPSCGDAQNMVLFPDGKWECNLCMATGYAG